MHPRKVATIKGEVEKLLRPGFIYLIPLTKWVSNIAPVDKKQGTGRLLGFIVSKDGIRLDPLKVEAIINLPSPSSLHQLQSLQGKANFLRHFIPNYAEVAGGYT